MMENRQKRSDDYIIEETLNAVKVMIHPKNMKRWKRLRGAFSPMEPDRIRVILRFSGGSGKPMQAVIEGAWK